MVEISIEGRKAVFTVQGQDKIWAFRSVLEIPLEHIRDAHEDPSPAMGWLHHGLKVLGTSIPNFFRAGTFYEEGGWVFWDVRHGEKAIVIELHDEHFQKLVVEVESPASSVRLLKDAIRRVSAS